MTFRVCAPEPKFAIATPALGGTIAAMLHVNGGEQ